MMFFLWCLVLLLWVVRIFFSVGRMKVVVLFELVCEEIIRFLFVIVVGMVWVCMLVVFL